MKPRDGMKISPDRPRKHPNRPEVEVEVTLPICKGCGTTDAVFVAAEYAASGLCGDCLWGDQPKPMEYDRG